MATHHAAASHAAGPTQAQQSQHELATAHDWSWAAGFLSALGTFTLHEGRPLLIVKSSRDLQSVQRLADVIGANANTCTINGKPGLRVTVSGSRLRQVMKRVWPELSETRRADYSRVRARAAEWAEAGEVVRAA